MTAKDALLLLLFLGTIAKIATWLLRHREWARTWVVMLLGFATQCIGWTVGAWSKVLDNYEMLGQSLLHNVHVPEGYKYPISIGVVLVDGSFTFLTLRERRHIRLARVEAALLGCLPEPTFDEYCKSLQQAGIYDKAASTEPELRRLSKDATHPELARRVTLVLKLVKDREA